MKKLVGCFFLLLYTLNVYCGDAYTLYVALDGALSVKLGTRSRSFPVYVKKDEKVKDAITKFMNSIGKYEGESKRNTIEDQYNIELEFKGTKLNPDSVADWAQMDRQGLDANLYPKNIIAEAKPQTYPVTLSWNHTYYDEMGYSSIDEDVYYVTKDETVKDLLEKFKKKEKLRSGYDATLSFAHKDLQPNAIVKDVIGNYNYQAVSIHVDIEKSKTQQPITPTAPSRMQEQVKPTVQPSSMPTAQPQPGMATIVYEGKEYTIAYGVYDTIGKVTEKLKQQIGAKTPANILLFDQPLDPNGPAQTFKRMKKIYAAGEKTR